MSKKNLIILVAVFFVVIGVVLGYTYFIDKPLGPSLKGAITEQPSSNINQASSLDQASTPGQESTPDQISTPTPESVQNQTNQASPLCGNKPVLTILLAGIDYRGDNWLYGLADSIRIVRIDFTNHKVSALTLERGIWVEIPDISDHYGITHGLLNQAYFYGTPGMGYYDGPGGGAGLLAATLKLNFGLDVDNYVVGSMDGFAKGIDALGGIDVYLPNPVNGDLPEGLGSTNYQNLGIFNAGMNHLDGAQALALARIRFGYSTIIRNQNQDAIIKGIYQKLTSPNIIIKVPEILNILKNSFLTDLTPRQIGDMICLVSKMNKSDLSFTALPSSDYVGSAIYDPDMKTQISYLKVDFTVLRSYINQFMSGQLP